MQINNIAIKVENISKRYRIGLKEEKHENIAEAFMDMLISPLKNYRNYRSLYKFDDNEASSANQSPNNVGNVLWALRDISFEVKKGQVLGVIGSNGAGKSTLLKILSRVTNPTRGKVTIYGTMASLLEVGTGFHDELTGRENIYLNGTIMGMKKSEVDRKFDEIVDFSGVERFIDTPVKRYSSGMKVRLAFSIGAHLDPEILIIDEVLAVGDLAFQNKCLGKMENVVNAGRTIIFVSHNMTAVESLCQKCIIIEDGKITFEGATDSAIKKYIAGTLDQSDKSIALSDRKDRTGNGIVKVVDIWMENGCGNRICRVACNENPTFKLKYVASEVHKSMNFVVSIYDDEKNRVLRFDSNINLLQKNDWPENSIVSCKITNPIGLAPGDYHVNFAVYVDNKLADCVFGATKISVIEGDFFGSGKLPTHWPMFLLKNEWRIDNS